MKAPLHKNGDKSRLYLFLVVLVLLLAAALRILAVRDAPPGPRFDETFDALMARRILNGERPIYFPENFGEEALYQYFQALSLTTFGWSDLALRFPSFVFGMLEVATVYALGRRVWNRRAGLLAGLPVKPVKVLYAGEFPGETELAADFGFGLWMWNRGVGTDNTAVELQGGRFRPADRGLHLQHLGESGRTQVFQFQRHHRCEKAGRVKLVGRQFKAARQVIAADLHPGDVVAVPGNPVGIDLVETNLYVCFLAAHIMPPA